MKLITAIIQPERLTMVKDALKEAGVAGVTVSEARGFGRQRGHTVLYRGSEYEVDFVQKVRIEIVVEDRAEVERIMNVLSAAARTGGIGDGKAWVTDVEWLVRFRTGEMNLDAL